MSLATAHGFSDDHQNHGRVANKLEQELDEIEQKIRARQQPRPSKEHVFHVIASILGAAATTGFKVLSAGIEILELAPVPGLASVGRTLLHIWEVLEHVQCNRCGCEDLMAFCVDAVDVIRTKVSGAGDAFLEELQGPIRKLNSALREASDLIEEQGPQSRLLRHRDIGHRIERCRTRIQECLSLFTAATSLDILKTVRALSPPHSISRSSQELPRIYTHFPTEHPQLWTVIPVDGPHHAEMEGGDLPQSPEHMMFLPDIKETTPAPSNLPHANESTERKRDYAREYANLVQHGFDDSLTLALWTPTHVSVGAVGYYSKESGSFITLFNALRPEDSLDEVATKIQSLSTFGPTKQVCIPHPRPSSCNVLRSEKRGISFNVRAGSAAAFLHTQRTTWRYLKTQAHQKHVTGTLDAREYAMFVCQQYPGGEVKFDIAPRAQPGQPWGTFALPKEDPAQPPSHGIKVSNVKSQKEKSDTVLLAELRLSDIKGLGPA
ncbi:hypothetical protein EVG20_g4719 [Dentipellis fragilis]|uniref:Uncharacterized protein n=1 Tax=Dentipellis fragilis TaxID=205917 RepID=A0A4Y9YZ25_9AGAM|nr:hypothetical protein EVG20_g4719 [Dentipellis fragilis]